MQKNPKYIPECIAVRSAVSLCYALTLLWVTDRCVAISAVTGTKQKHRPVAGLMIYSVDQKMKVLSRTKF